MKKQLVFLILLLTIFLNACQSSSQIQSSNTGIFIFIIILGVLLTGGVIAYTITRHRNLLNDGFKYNELSYFNMKFPKDSEFHNFFVKQKRRLKQAGVDFEIRKMYYFYLRLTDLDNKAIKEKIADFVSAIILSHHEKLDIDKEDLKDHILGGGKAENYIKQIMRAKKENVDIDIEKMHQANLPGEEMTRLVEAMILAQSAEVQISQKELIEAHHDGIDFLEYVNALIMTKNIIPDIKTLKKRFKKHNHTGGDILKLAYTMVRIANSGLPITIEDLEKKGLTGQKLGQVAKVLVRAQNAGVQISLNDLVACSRVGCDLTKISDALFRIKAFMPDVTLKDLRKYYNQVKDEGDESYSSLIETCKRIMEGNLDISFTQIIELKGKGVNELSYVKALGILKGQNFTNVTPEQLRNDAIEGRNVLPALLAQMKNTDFKYQTAINLDRLGGNIMEVLKQTLHPKQYSIETEITLQSGTIVKLPIYVFLLIEIKNYFFGDTPDDVMEHVKKVVTEEMANYSSPAQLLKDLNVISANALNKFQLQDELNSKRKYQLVNLYIYGLEIIKNIYGHVKKHHAEEDAFIINTKAHAKYLDAKAEVEKAFAEAIRMGKAGDNAYFKKSLYEDKDSVLDKKTEHEDGVHGQRPHGPYGNHHEGHDDSHGSDDSHEHDNPQGHH